MPSRGCGLLQEEMDCVTMLCLSQASPMKALLDQGQREAVADLVNAAVLDLAAGHRHSFKTPPRQVTHHGLV